MLLKKKKESQLTLLYILLLVTLGMLTIPFVGLMNHRYYLPLQIIAILLAFSYLQKRTVIYSWMLVLALVLGNLIIYPKEIAQGWDSTAAHWPYYSLERQMNNYIQSESALGMHEVGTAFPLYNKREHLALDDSKPSYHPYDFSKDKYILWSNINNDYTDDQMAKLSEWKIVKQLESRGVTMILYQRPE